MDDRPAHQSVRRLTVINHVTYHVPAGTLDDPNLSKLMSSLGLEEVDALDPFEHGWKVRWWRAWYRTSKVMLHLVETDDGEQDMLSLGHFCISGNRERYETLKASRWCTRNSGSGRIWLEFANLRIEVRP